MKATEAKEISDKENNIDKIISDQLDNIYSKIVAQAHLGYYEVSISPQRPISKYIINILANQGYVVEIETPEFNNPRVSYTIKW